MNLEDAAYNRILELEDALARYTRRLLVRNSEFMKAGYVMRYNTYLLNIAIFNNLSGASYKPQVQAIE